MKISNKTRNAITRFFNNPRLVEKSNIDYSASLIYNIDCFPRLLYRFARKIENGVRAVEKYAELKPDLVLMDITMPEMDGIEALKKIKAADPNANVVMCSAMGQQAMVIESIQAGAKDFIVKPFQAERVIEAVKKVVG